MKVLRELIGSIPDELFAEEVVVGVFWTMVFGQRPGIASTFAPPHPHMEAPVRYAGFLSGRPIKELASLLLEGSLLEASIGLAALNASIKVEERWLTEVNAFDVLIEKAKGRPTVLIGHFPFVDELKQVAKPLWVLELNPQEGDIPAERASEVLPQASVIAMTSTVLINRTVEELLKLCPPGSFKALIGPSTPLSPLLFDMGFDILAGALVKNPARVKQAVVQGATFRQLKGFGVKLVTMSKG